jgi:hypothetical protein
MPRAGPEKAAGSFWCLTARAQQLRQLGGVGGDAPGLVAGEQACDLRDAVRNCRGEEKLRKSEGEAPFQASVDLYQQQLLNLTESEKGATSND